MVCVALSAQAVPTLELKELPPLKPLNWCKHADGHVRGQIEPCGPDTPAASSEDTVRDALAGAAAGSAVDPLGTASPKSPAASASESAQKAESDKLLMKGARKSLLKLLGFALVFGVIARLIGRSFVRWFLVGIVLHIVLVAMNVLSF
jgi:hypothetical protein